MTIAAKIVLVVLFGGTAYFLWRTYAKKDTATSPLVFKPTFPLQPLPPAGTPPPQTQAEKQAWAQAQRQLDIMA